MSLSIIVRNYRFRSLLGIRGVRQFATSGELKAEEKVLPVDQKHGSELENSIEERNEEYIDHIRNKSRLHSKDFRKIHKKPPLLSEDEKYVYSILRLRRTYGEYGSESGIDVGLLWPSKEEMELQKEKERVTYSDDVHRMIEIDRQNQEGAEQRILARQEDLDKKVAKLEGWKKEVRQRIAQQNRVVREAKEKKERVMEEVRQMFGFRIDPKDERYKEALVKREMEERKAARAAKKLIRQQKMIAEIQKLSQDVTPKSDANSGDDSQSAGAGPGAEPAKETKP